MYSQINKHYFLGRKQIKYVQIEFRRVSVLAASFNNLIWTNILVSLFFVICANCIALTINPTFLYNYLNGKKHSLVLEFGIFKEFDLLCCINKGV